MTEFSCYIPYLNQCTLSTVVHIRAIVVHIRAPIDPWLTTTESVCFLADSCHDILASLAWPSHLFTLYSTQSAQGKKLTAFMTSWSFQSLGKYAEGRTPPFHSLSRLI
jgi:hypothetical protein